MTKKKAKPYGAAAPNGRRGTYRVAASFGLLPPASLPGRGQRVQLRTQQYPGAGLDDVWALAAWLTERCSKFGAPSALASVHVEELSPEGAWTAVVETGPSGARATPSAVHAAVQRYMEHPWTRCALSGTDGQWTAFVREMPRDSGWESSGETEQQALDGLDSLLYDWLWDLVRSGGTVPTPAWWAEQHGLTASDRAAPVDAAAPFEAKWPDSVPAGAAAADGEQP